MGATVMSPRHKSITPDHFDAVLFDLDGVLTSTAKIHSRCWKTMFDDFLGRRSAAPEKGFFFRLPDDGTVAAAHTVEEFDQALASVPTASLEHHVARGDFSRWARDVLGDADLVAGLAKLETTSATGAPVDREELRRHLHARYVL
jgi:beta-phosphoglucomutase-like phosphatase (HAD superfamily)